MIFEVALSDAAQQLGLPFYDGPAPFATLPYAQETQIKQLAWKRYLQGLNLRFEVGPLVMADMPRHYRITSRRKVWMRGTRRELVLGDGSTPAEAELLELPSHVKIYETVSQIMGKIDVLQHVIVRGTYDEHAVIFNVRTIDAALVRTIRKWMDKITDVVPEVKHGWIYVDPTSSKYYLEQDRPLLPVSSKKILGSAAWNQVVEGVGYQVGVFSFTQGNLAMVPKLMSAVKAGLTSNPNDEALLVDLYSGYGLFGSMMATNYKEVLAIDIDKSTIANAAYNIRRAGGQVRIMASTITTNSLSNVHILENTSLDVIMDPPRKGTEFGVIERVANWNPRSVVEVFCNADEVGRSIREWKSHGYEPDSVTGLDLFPGTDGIEVVVAFRKAQQRDTRDTRGYQPRTERTSSAHRKTSR